MGRTYDQSHPWITFHANLGPAPAEFWQLLGEAQSKIEHIANVPLQPHVHEYFNKVYLAKGVLATTAIEGNTLSEEEALAHLSGKLSLPPSREYLGRELDNIVKAINLVWRDKTGEFEAVSTPLIRRFNELVLEGLTLEPGVVPGQLRQHEVGVARYKAAPYQDCEFLLERLATWLRAPEFVGTQDRKLGMAITRAVIAHLYIAWIHPFGDGNGRTARLLEFQILAQAGVPMSSAHLLSNHYNKTRTEYYRQLDYASRSGGDVVQFLIYAVRGLVDGLREQLVLVRDEQWEAAWRDYIHKNLSLHVSKTNIRRRTLVLELSKKTKPVPRSKLVFLSPEIAESYKGKTGKTLTRDLNELLEMGMVRREPEGYKINKRIMLAFAPMRKREKRPQQQDLPAVQGPVSPGRD
jgi:cell filamentation protein, protein adenylyltransferase